MLKNNPACLAWLGTFLCLLFNYVQNKFAFYLIFSGIKSAFSEKSQVKQINNSKFSDEHIDTDRKGVFL